MREKARFLPRVIRAILGWRSSIIVFLLFGDSLALAQEKVLSESRDLLKHFSIRNEPWYNPDVCGLNCLVMFFILHGRQVNPREMVAGLPVTSKGLSLKALQNYSLHKGFEVHVVKATPSSLHRIPLPAIAHLGQGVEDHYVLLCDVDNTQVTIFDGTSFSVERKERENFEKDWSGYLIIAQALQGHRWLLGCLFLVGALGLVWFVLRLRCERRM